MKFFRSLQTIAFVLPVAAFSQAGYLDPSFGTTGIVLTDLDIGQEGGNQLAIQNDGKIIQVGWSSGTYFNFAVVRYLTDGTLDPAFDTDGIVIAEVGPTYNGAEDVVIQPDGKIVVAGSGHDGTSSGYKLARFHSDGTPDSTFDSDGFLEIYLLSSYTTTPELTLLDDGKIMLVGSQHDTPGAHEFCLIRINADGSLDLSFDSDGIVLTDFAGQGDYGNTMTIQSDGKIVVAGYSYGNGHPARIALARYNTDGTPDNSFSTDGLVVLNSSFDHSMAHAIHLLPGGKILIGGTTFNGSNTDLAFLRFNTDGSVDPTFGNSGVITINFNNEDQQFHDMAVQTDGKMVITGLTGSANHTFFTLRLDTDYDMDNAFGNGGFTTTFINGNDLSFATAIQADGKIVVGGVTSGGESTFAIVRYMGESFAANETPEVINPCGAFPNPTTAMTTIRSGHVFENTTLTLSDASGKTIYREENLSGKEFVVDLANQNNGIYVVTFHSAGHIEQFKLVKQ